MSDSVWSWRGMLLDCSVILLVAAFLVLWALLEITVSVISWFVRQPFVVAGYVKSRWFHG